MPDVAFRGKLYFINSTYAFNRPYTKNCMKCKARFIGIHIRNTRIAFYFLPSMNILFELKWWSFGNARWYIEINNSKLKMMNGQCTRMCLFVTRNVLYRNGEVLVLELFQYFFSFYDVLPLLRRVVVDVIVVYMSFFLYVIFNLSIKLVGW